MILFFLCAVIPVDKERLVNTVESCLANVTPRLSSVIHVTH